MKIFLEFVKKIWGLSKILIFTVIILQKKILKTLFFFKKKKRVYFSFKEPLKMRANFKPFALIFAVFLLLLILTDSQVQSSPVPNESKLLRRRLCCDSCPDPDPSDPSDPPDPSTITRYNQCIRNCIPCMLPD